MDATATPTSRDFRPVIRAVGVAALLGILVTILVGPSEPLQRGRPAPVTRGTALDGGAFDLAEWRGQPVFVNVWATWCGPCRMELPELADAARAHPEVRFVGLVADSPADDAVAVAARYGLPYPNVPIDGGTQHAWNADALPSSFFVDEQGVIQWSGRGAMTRDDVESVLRAGAQQQKAQQAQPKS